MTRSQPEKTRSLAVLTLLHSMVKEHTSPYITPRPPRRSQDQRLLSAKKLYDVSEKYRGS
jgi:hypothetical protein